MSEVASPMTVTEMHVGRLGQSTGAMMTGSAGSSAQGNADVDQRVIG